MARLLYSHDDNNQFLGLAALRELDVPAARGRFHQPYGFGQYVDDVVEQLDVLGLWVGDSEFEVTPDHNRFFGALAIEPKPLQGDLITATEWEFLLGLRGSHDQSVPRGLAVGSRTFVCSNLAFHGDLGTLHTKQTLNIGARLPGLIREALAQLPEQASRLEHKFNVYRDTEFKQRWGDAALVEVHRRGGLSSAQLGRAISEWDHPTYAEHAEGGYTAWRFLQACTEAVKPTGHHVNHNLIEQRTRIADSFLNEVVDVRF